MGVVELVTAADLARVEAKLDRIAAMLEGPRDEWKTMPQACAEAGVSAATIRAWARTGQIESKGRGKLRRFRL